MAITTAAASQQVPTTEYSPLEERIGAPHESFRRLAEVLDLAGC